MTYRPIPYGGENTDADWPSPADQMALEGEWREEAEEKICDRKWWEWSWKPDGFEIATTECLATCMSNLNRACKGELIALQAITTALSNLQREAKLKAYEEARDL